jgi:hypothetical protein
VYFHVAGGGGSTGTPGFTPPPGVVVFDGSQQIPGPDYTLKIAENDLKCDGELLANDPVDTICC